MTGTATRGAMNLIARLDDERFTQRTVHPMLEELDRRDVRVERFHETPEHVLAWIDAEFGGTWSSEARLGGICIARDAAGFAGFAAYGARGLRFGWLRAWRDRPDVGIFGPFGVARRLRCAGVGRALLRFALLSLRERGYARALIPVVDGAALVAYYEREAGARAVESVDLSHGGRRWRATVLASGNGSNFQSVVDGSRDAERPLPIDVTSLLCNRPSAGVLSRAADAGIPSMVLAWDRVQARAEYDTAVASAVEETRPDLVLLLGWMHVLPRTFVARFPETLNIHPAFLPLDAHRDDVTMPDGSIIPALRGPRAVDDAIAAGLGWGGATVHRVTAEVDRGPVLARAPLMRQYGEDRDGFLTRLHRLEHGVLATAIRRWSYERDDAMAAAL